MKLHVLLVFATLASACDPCHSWDEVKIVDRKGLDEGEAITSIQDAIDTFAGWTGRETTCVGKVKVVEELETSGQRVGGIYNSRASNISIRHRQNWLLMGDIASHEFCHAVDDEEGWPSLDMAEALEPYTEGLNEDLYDTDDARTIEAFANICAMGPSISPLWLQFEEACGEDVVDEAYQLVHELLYSSWDAQAELGRFEGTLEQWEISDIEDYGATRGDIFVGAALVVGAHGLLALEPLLNLDEAGEFESWQPVLRLIDPHSATELDSLALAPVEDMIGRDYNNNPYWQTHELLGSSGDPLIYDRAQPGTAWRVRGDPLALEAVDFPMLPEEAIIRGFEHQGSALAWVRTAQGDTISTANLKDEAWTPVNFDDDERFEGSGIRAFEADAEGAVVLIDGPSGLAVAGLTMDGTPLWYQGLGCTDCDAYSVSRLPDGSVLVPVWVDVGGQTYNSFPIRVDPADGSLSTPNGDCNSVQYYLGGVAWDGGQWMLYSPRQDDYSRGPLTLMQLHIDPE